MSVIALYNALASPFIEEREKKRRLKPICAQGDWDAWSRVLERERLATFTYAELSKLGLLEHVPEALAVKWRRHSVQLSVLGEKHIGLLRRLVQMSDSAAIPMLCMRTPYLNTRIYGGNLAVRPFSDVDIAVRPEDRLPFMEVLRERFGDSLRIRGSQRTHALKSEFGSRIEAEVDGLNIDIHWNLTLHYNFCRNAKQAARQAGIWERMLEVDLPWGRCRVLSDADLLVHLAQHAAIQHDLRDRPFSQLIDYARLASALGGNVNPQDIGESVRDFGCPSALSAISYCVEQYIAGASENGLLRWWSNQLRPTARRTVRNYVKRRGEDFERIDSDSTTGSFRIFSGEQLRQMVFMASVADGGSVRAALTRQYLLPTRAMVDYATNRATSLREYMTFLLLYVPAGQLYLLPIIGALAAQHFHELLFSRPEYVEADAQTVD